MKQSLKDRITKPPLKSGVYVHNGVWRVVSSLPDNVQFDVSHSIGRAVETSVRRSVWYFVNELLWDM